VRGGIPSGRRHFKPPPGDAVSVDPGEQAALERSGEAMLEALAREHPERATESHPAGTKLPRRVSAPSIDSGLKSNFEQ
jgi:hypothetical protein